MSVLRISQTTDIPRLRELWTLAFGDGGAYLDNFFQVYYRPERMVVLEEEGRLLAMTAWFDTALSLPDGSSHRAAYLYAVATHPQARSRGLAGKLLAWADDYFRELGIPAVTTVPAEPSLHRFFGRNGFRECFVHREERYTGPTDGRPASFSLEPVPPAIYASFRESLLAGTAHIVLPEEAVAYQAGACALAPGGGLYAADTGRGGALVCAEGMEDGRLLIKELLGCREAVEALLPHLNTLLPGWCGVYRTPGSGTAFGMLKWLEPAREKAWDWDSTAYLGLAFD